MRNHPARYALVVGDSAGAAMVEESLSEAIPVSICPGPDVKVCPAFRGKPCPLRDEAAISVVYVERDEGFATLPCATISESPTVLVLKGVDLEPTANATSGFAMVGAERGAGGVLAAIARLIAT
ncbi:MAG: hypothetical protein ACLGIB_12955 [Actinomycetota bacterium]